MKKLSCIVIGKNQINTITQCLDSVFAAIQANALTCYEVIYVDSLSTDNTIEHIKKRYGDTVAVYQLTHAMNAAIARNVGVKYATGDVYFFVDGDMVVDSRFMALAFFPERGLEYDAVSGRLEEVLYNSKWEKNGYVEDRYNVTSPRFDTDMGGVFFINANVFHAIKGFRNHMKQHQDMDLCFRLIRSGYQFWRLPCRIATHHTIHIVGSYTRIFKLFWNRNMMYTGVLLRENILSNYCWKKYCKQQRFLLLLVACVALAVFVHPAFLLIYPLAIYAKYKHNPGHKYWQTLVITILWNIAAVAGLLYFPPRIYEKDIVVERK